MFLGIDIGSSSSKAALLGADGAILALAAVNLGTGTNGPEQALEQACQIAGVRREELLYTVATGYGRMNYQGADRQVTEISCHAKGVHRLAPGARTVIDIGGQDAKAIRLDADGFVTNFVMNDKCAAGTGRFLEVMARVLGCEIGGLGELARKSTQVVSISSVCTVFAESEVISRLAAGAAAEDVAAGAMAAVASRVAGMASRVDPAPEVVMSGGVALNSAMVEALSAAVGLPVTVAYSPQTVGALGAACFAREQYLQQQ